ncbi:phage tail protein [Citrobacter freundii]|nr:phage tail protein [Citrobacter freundii]
MAGKLSTEILINLAGNLQAKARQYGANMSEFAARHKRSMAVVQATSEAAGRGFDMLGNRYTGMIAGFAGGAMLREFTELDRRLTRIGIAAGKTREQMSEISGMVMDTSIKFKIDERQLLSAIEKTGTVTGDVNFGVKNRDLLGATIAASGATGESVGDLFSVLTKFKIDSDAEAYKAIDTANRLGKEGAYELKDIAEKGGKAFSLYAAAGGRGVEGFKDVLVALESSIDATGNRDTAATVTENFIKEVQNPKTVKTLRGAGIEVFDKDGNIRKLPKLLEEIALKSGSKGTETQKQRLLDAGFNDDSTLLISSVTSGKGAENLKRYQSVVGDGKGILEDAVYAAKDFTSAMQGLTTTWNKFANGHLAKPVQDLADALNGLEPGTVQRWLEISKNVAIATAGVVAARKAFKIGKGAWDILGPGKGKGLPKGVTDVFGSGVMPVYVVNMGAGGLGGASGADLPDGRNRPNRPGGRPRPGQMPGGFSPLFLASTIPFLAEEPNLSDDQKNDMVKWAQERAKGPSLWARLTDYFTSAAENPAITDPRPWAVQQPAPAYPVVPPSLQGEIRVVVEGDARVKSVRMDQPGIRLSAQAGVSSVEQD